MKRLLIFIPMVLIALSASAQNDSPIFDDFIEKYQQLEEKYGESYQAKDYKQTEVLLKEMLTMCDALKLSDEQMPEYEKVMAMIRANTYYNLACTYSLLNDKKQAVSAFEKAVEFGYSEYGHAKTDSDLDNIRREKKFIALMDSIRIYDKLYILQHAGRYAQSDRDSLPKFTYQSEANNNLKQVRKYFNLDSIAGDGDELSQIVNLLLFVSDSVKYDGGNWALCEFDAIDFYNYHKATGKGINCRHKAMMLNEIYLAMGFYSRYVTCMPKDQDDPDCHVINCVYSQTLKKWLWMDPSHGIYVMDENNNPLSISEVRERLINGEPLVLNKETTKKKEWYLDSYMAKNLYWIQCTNVSRFNTETRYRNRDKDVVYIALIPVGYNDENRYLQNNVITHDAGYFWQISPAPVAPGE
ncbi:transglutaminase domain-containing protein [uncultured Alistipes sp.]|jgi:hypothetical protein|uniref:TPR end-of-group domain-containing protein n=1 Tax=uncultured Alistipes sp. TaxID=538949 RepID=UPI0025F561B1|nr:transglutaminase domain-containing protein [uncultured Alistipes sp.]